MTDQSLDGRIAIVTGAGRGLGRAMTLGLAEAGAHVVATAAREADELKALAADAKDMPGRIVPVVADVTREEDAARVVATAIAEFGALHVLVNNAGRGMKYINENFMTKPTGFWETDPDVWRMVIDTNVNGPFLMARAAVPHLIAAGAGGRIVNISASAGTMQRKGFSPYGPSKAALESETIIWSRDLADTGATVNALLPGGATATGMVPDSFPDEARSKLLDPAIMAPPMVWLASRRSDGVTGRRIIANRWTRADVWMDACESVLAAVEARG